MKLGKNSKLLMIGDSIWRKRWAAGVAVVLAAGIAGAQTTARKSGGRAALPARSAEPYLGAIAVDAATGQVLAEDRADEQGYPASVIKLMDMLVILEQAGTGQLNLSNQVTVTAAASRMGGSQVYLKEKESFPLDDLLYALMIQSANDAAVALALHVAGGTDAFVEKMNAKAAELGMTRTKFCSVHGLPPASGQEVDVSTARDLATLARALIQKTDILRYTSTRERGFRGDSFIMRNHNHLLGACDGCDGLKTGFFTAGGFSIVATAQRGGRRVIAVVLGSRDRKVRDAKAVELLAKGFAALPALPPPAPAVTNVADLPPAAGEIEPEPSHRSGWILPAVMGLVGGLAAAGIVAWVMGRSRDRAI